jgi:hypothetical protein
MKSALSQCPVCNSELTITRLHCSSCDTAIEGRFNNAGVFSGLSADQMTFLLSFVRCEGKFSRMEKEFGLSYPTLRSRLQVIIRALGYEPGVEEAPDPEADEDRRRKILEDLDGGKISAEDAMRILQGEGQ